MLARAGLLDGCQATVHWEDLDEFAQAFPNIDVVSDRYVVDTNRITIGGAMPALDFMLYLIGCRYGNDLAKQVASAFIYDENTSGRQQQGTALRVKLGDGLVEMAVQMMAERLEEPLLMPQIARVLNISLRQLEQRFQASLATSPARYARELRLQKAARLARDSALRFTDIALQCGFASQAVFTRSFQSRFSLTPMNYRRKYGTLILKPMA